MCVCVCVCVVDRLTKSRPDMIFTRAASSLYRRTSLAMIAAAIAGNAYNNNKIKIITTIIRDVFFSTHAYSRDREKKKNTSDE